MSEYIPIGWKNRLVEKPMTYRMVNNGDGTITLTRESGEVYEEGTAVNADNLNHMEDGIRRAVEASGRAAIAAFFTVTLTAAGWTGDAAPYAQTVALDGMLATDMPIADVVQSGVEETDAALRENIILVTRMVAGDNALTAYASEIPEVDLPVQMVVIRG